MSMHDDPAGWRLVVAFPDESPSFAHGVEVGKLWEQMKRGIVAEISLHTMIENHEVLRRVAEYLGWEFSTISTTMAEWEYSTFVKRKSVGTRVNPHGLHIVSRRLDDGCERG